MQDAPIIIFHIRAHHKVRCLQVARQSRDSCLQRPLNSSDPIAVNVKSSFEIVENGKLRDEMSVL